MIDESEIFALGMEACFRSALRQDSWTIRWTTPEQVTLGELAAVAPDLLILGPHNVEVDAFGLCRQTTAFLPRVSAVFVYQPGQDPWFEDDAASVGACACLSECAPCDALIVIVDQILNGLPLLGGRRGRVTPVLPVLSQRQRQVLQGVAAGHTAEQIAANLGLANFTVLNYVQHSMEKLMVHDRQLAVRRARRLGLLDPL